MAIKQSIFEAAGRLFTRPLNAMASSLHDIATGEGEKTDSAGSGPGLGGEATSTTGEIRQAASRLDQMANELTSEMKRLPRDCAGPARLSMLTIPHKPWRAPGLAEAFGGETQYSPDTYVQIIGFALLFRIAQALTTTAPSPTAQGLSTPAKGFSTTFSTVAVKKAGVAAEKKFPPAAAPKVRLAAAAIGHMVPGPLASVASCAVLGNGGGRAFGKPFRDRPSGR
ncbi:hypothetical protein [Thiohalorhabdus sp.]|uniref:hypothetical protein n=1 Tax=Thiohalorhabdus sp. TaxID=3094134 RepID=UPI002FC284EF